MARLMVAGGMQREAGVLDRDHSRLFGTARAVIVDTADGSMQVLTDYRDAPNVCEQRPDRVGHVFKGISKRPGGWLLCTQRTVVWVDSKGVVERSWSSPLLNDAHHAIAHDGALWIASTGLDAVLEVRNDKTTMHPLSDELGRDVDYRCLDRRPHAVHPNHLFVHEGILWVTCLHERGVRNVLAGERKTIASERLHDGVVHDDLIWFTTVDGYLVGIDAQGDLVRRVCLADSKRVGEPLGWCRGLTISEGVAWVGFSRLRATPWRHHLAWMRGAVRGWQVATRRPSHIAGFDLATGTQVASWTLEPTLHACFGLEALD